MSVLRVACVQLRSGTDVAENIEAASLLIRQAVQDGASFVATPEMTSLMDMRKGRLLAQAVAEADDLALAAFRALASELKLWLLIGSLPIRVADDRCANRSFFLGPDGEVRARYDKIHMFDVEVGDGQTYRESATFAPGDRLVVADLPWGRIGLSVCYDLRFPTLYRRLAQAGASLILVPAAFTQTTGEAHWHVLLRARAVETGAFVMAPAQGGRHADGRETYGHSLVVGPWGDVRAEAGTEPGLILADLDMADVQKARSRIPAWQLERPMAVSP